MIVLYPHCSCPLSLDHCDMGSLHHGITATWDHCIMGSLWHGITVSWDHCNMWSQPHRSTVSWITVTRDHCIMGSMRHEITATWDHCVMGSRWHGITVSWDQWDMRSVWHGITVSWDHCIMGSLSLCLQSCPFQPILHTELVEDLSKRKSDYGVSLDLKKEPKAFSLVGKSYPLRPGRMACWCLRKRARFSPLHSWSSVHSQCSHSLAHLPPILLQVQLRLHPF